MSVTGRSAAWLDRADRLGRGIENLLLAGLLLAMLLLAGAQILLRNLGEGGFPWADEALRIMVLWLAMLGAVAASRDNRHIAIDALARLLPARLQALTGAIIAALTATICLLIGWHASSLSASRVNSATCCSVSSLPGPFSRFCQWPLR